MKIAIFYNSTEAQSIAATLVLKSKYRDEEITAVDLAGKNESQMTTAIDTITDATIDRVFSTCITTASYSAAGHPSIDVNIPDMEDKISADAESPWDEAISLGDPAANKNAVLRAWENAYPGIAYPPIVKYLGGSAVFPTKTGTATSVAASTLTHTGAFTASAHVGQYVYIVSATTGAGQVIQIASNTTGALTLARDYALRPTGTIVYGIVPYKEDALRAEALALAVKSKMWNISSANVMALWYQLTDLGGYDDSYNSINSGNLVSPSVDLAMLDALIEVGRSIYEYTVFPGYGVEPPKKLK